MIKRTILMSAAAMCLSTAAMADIVVTKPFAQIVREGAPVASAYVTMENTGDKDDSLVGVESAVAGHTELHTTTVDENGVARMSAISDIPIPAGEAALLEPGKEHIMLMQLAQPLSEGDEVEITLQFANSPDQTLVFVTRKAGSAP